MLICHVYLPDRHVEAALLDFVLDVAAAFLTLVAEHFGEYPLEGVVTNGLGDRVIAVVADVEGGAEEVARAVGGILVMALQLCHIVHAAQHAGDDELVEGHALDIEAVVEGLPDVLQQKGSTGNEVRNGAGETVNMIVRALADVDELVHAFLGILTIPDRPYAPFLGSHNLHALAVGEGCLVVGHTTDGVIGVG